ncbi:MAG: stage III sporulation AC/AD family protein [Clostridia bacterium]|nr:stage III sporulation AC/AD family protein [Clostridia bacterium]
MALVLRASGIALSALAVILVLRGTSGVFATLVKVGAVVLLFGMALAELSSGLADIKDAVSGIVDGDSFTGRAISVMLKALGIALVGRVCADICKECGEQGLAQGVESVSGIVIFSLSVPILSEILFFASDVLKRGA